MASRTFASWVGGLILAVLAPGCSGTASGQEIAWRSDYAAAVKEAAAKDLPLIVAVGSPGCTWCHKMDATTYADPKVAAALTREFIPLKLDAVKHVQTVRALRVQAVPTALFATADGRILHVVNGYVDAKKMDEHLRYAQSALQSLRKGRKAEAAPGK